MSVRPPNMIRDGRRRRAHLQLRGRVELAVELGPAGLHSSRISSTISSERLPRWAKAGRGGRTPHGTTRRRDPGRVALRQDRCGTDRLGRRIRAAQRRDVDGGDEPDLRRARPKRADQHPRIGPIGERRPASLAVLGVRVGRVEVGEVDHVIGESRCRRSRVRRRPSRARRSRGCPGIRR